MRGTGGAVTTAVGARVDAGAGAGAGVGIVAAIGGIGVAGCKVGVTSDEAGVTALTGAAAGEGAFRLGVSAITGSATLPMGAPLMGRALGSLLL